MKLSPFLERRYRALLIIAAAEAPLATLELPGVRVRGTTNGSQGTSLLGRKLRRAKQRGLRSLGHNAALALKLKALLDQHGGLVVRVVRVAPNRLDGDNLEASLKRIRDGLAKCIGVDDRRPAVEYVPDDRQGGVREYAVRFEVFSQRQLPVEAPTQQQRENAQLAEGIISSYRNPPLTAPASVPGALALKPGEVIYVDRHPTPNVRKPVAP